MVGWPSDVLARGRIGETCLVAAGLAETIRWYRDHESWWRPAKGATEVRYHVQGQ